VILHRFLKQFSVTLFVGIGNNAVLLYGTRETISSPSNRFRAYLTGDFLIPRFLASSVSISLSPGLIEPVRMALSIMVRILSDKLRWFLRVRFNG